MSLPVPEPRVARFENMAFGLFIHWGLYSLLGRGEWAQSAEKIDTNEYRKLTDRFTAEDFDATAIARLARQAGIRYITLTTRHHDGFSLYNTRGLDGFDALHSAAKRDLIAEFVEGCRSCDILPIFYHTTLDWRWQTMTCDLKQFEEYLDYLYASVEILCKHYGPIGGLWFDGNWSRPDVDWKEDRLYAMIRKHQPDAIIVNNTGMQKRGQTGHPEIDSLTYERGMPSPINRDGMSKYVAGEMCQTVNQHWGIATNDFNHKSPAELIRDLCACRKVGANYLLNVGPTAGGLIPPYESATLERIGLWVDKYAESIYQGKPVDCRCSGEDFLLRVADRYYFFVHDLKRKGDANVTINGGSDIGRTIKGFDRPVRSVRWLDNDETLEFTQDSKSHDLTIECTGYPYGTDLVVRVARIDS